MKKSEADTDIAIVGSGIMSATLAVMLKRLSPGVRIQVYEAASELAQESSAGWHNAGTGHAGLCELSYTPGRLADGRVDVGKAIKVFEQFEVSRQFWASCVHDGVLSDPQTFLQPVPHLSFVEGEEQIRDLSARFEALQQHHFFEGMEFTSDADTVYRWAPLLGGRGHTPVAATRADNGTDVNFGNLAQQLLGWLDQQEGTSVQVNSRVTGLEKIDSGWRLTVVRKGIEQQITAGFVFVGAGGGSLPLLQKSGIPESKGIGAFPIGGQWLVCENPVVIKQHHAKVYGQALGAAPTMAVPHLDTRVLDDKTYLLFGPFAAWTTKFLHKSGSWLDLARSVKPHNLAGLVTTGISNLDLIRYLIDQGLQTKAQRVESLRQFYPEARDEDWKLIDAGIRVQAIKNTDGKAGIVHYGTELITDADKTISALLGASPGASVSADIALQVVRKCFGHLLATTNGQSRMKELVPTFDIDIKNPANREFYQHVSREASRSLLLPEA